MNWVFWMVLPPILRLMAKEGIKGTEAINAHYKTICEMVDGDISAEVLSTDFKTIVEEGKKLAAIHPKYHCEGADD